MKTVVLITTGQPSVNPRIVKEAEAFHTAGYSVVMLYCYWIEWASEADEKLLKNVKWEYQLIGGSPKNNKIEYFFTKARFKFNKFLNRQGYNKYFVAERSQARCYDELLKAAKSIKADIYIGHNLGSLPIVAKSAAYNRTVAGFDFEDYHREENHGEKEYLSKRVVFIEETYIPFIHYLSTSSPQITERVKRNFPSYNRPVFTLLNCFPLSQRSKKIDDCKDSNTMQLFWFSQTIGKNRGLEEVVLALKALNKPLIHLTLAGRCDIEMVKFIDEMAGDIKECIHFAGIIQPNDLPAFAAGFDVGLATEITTPLNRNICLTNKIFTYLLAGNCILASDTEAQKDFMDTHRGLGLLYKSGDLKDLAEKISFLHNDRSFLSQCKQISFTVASNTLNWENESGKLLDTVSSMTVT